MELDRELLLKKINLFSIEDNRHELIKILCEIIDDKIFFDKNIDLAIYIMKMCELYGYAMYFEANAKLEDFKFNLSEVLRHDMYKSKLDSNKHYNAGQLSLLNEIEKNKRVFISAPTSFGKTSLIMEYIYINYLKLHNIIFIVPTNSLMEELYIKFLKINKICDYKYNITTVPKKKENNNIWILTPEKFLLLFENFDKYVDLFIMDESYKIEDEGQIGNFDDVLNTRSSKYRKTMEIIAKIETKSIFLSPYTYSKDESMIRFLNKYSIKTINRDFNYVQKNIYDISNGRNFCQVFNTSGIIYKNDISGIKKALKTITFLNDNTIIYVRYPREAIEIINSTHLNYQFNMNSNERYKEFIKHLEDKYLFDDSKWYVIDALKKGIGIYVSPIPRYIKREIINLFNSGVLKILIVTTAFAEGVNSSAKNIIITNGVAGNRKLTTLDLLNLSGRAGRFGVYSVGNVYVASNETYNILKESSETGVTIKNSNYRIFNYDEIRTDYDLDIIDDEIMNQGERKRKDEVLKRQEKLELTDADLNIALSISKADKLKLYSFFVEKELDTEAIYLNIKNLMSDDRKNVVDSIKFVFNQLRMAGIRINSDFGDIPAYNYNNEFIWGDFYAIHSSGDIKNILKNRKKYIIRKIGDIKFNLNGLKKEQLKNVLKQYNCSWISEFLTDGIIDDTKLYNGAFKFISNIVEYRIPFYVGFYVSVFKLYSNKKKLNYNFDFEIADISTSLENKKVDDKNEKMIDYGFPIDMIKKISQDDSKLDNYEVRILKEYKELLSQQ